MSFVRSIILLEKAIEVGEYSCHMWVHVFCGDDQICIDIQRKVEGTNGA